MTTRTGPLPTALVIRACEHPSAVDVGAMGDVWDQLLCNSCGAVWTTPRDGMSWEKPAWAPKRVPTPGFHASTVDLWPDPRISNQRPGWLADDQQWRDQLQAMDRGDCHWIERQWELAGGAEPAVDMSWVTTTEIPGPMPRWMAATLGAMAGAVFSLMVSAATGKPLWPAFILALSGGMAGMAFGGRRR